MTGPTGEAGLVQAIRRAVARDYPSAWQFKVAGSPYQVVGIPDLLFCVNGLLVGMEVKFLRPGESEAHAFGRVTPIQWNQLRMINEAGGIASAVLSVQEALDLIKTGLSKQESRFTSGYSEGIG